MPQSKLMKSAVKRLKKLWPPTKKRKRLSSDWYSQHHHHYLDLTAPPPQFHRRWSCPSSSVSPSAQPSAPPLPPWLESDQSNHYAIPPVQDNASWIEPVLSEDHAVSPVQDDNDLGSDIVTSYQQYMVPEPVYGFPVHRAPATREESAAAGGSGGGGFFGWLAKFGINVFRCFCPCFHIREVPYGKIGTSGNPKH